MSKRHQYGTAPANIIFPDSYTHVTHHWRRWLVIWLVFLLLAALLYLIFLLPRTSSSTALIISPDAALLALADRFARTVTQQDWLQNTQLFVPGSHIDFHRAFTFLSDHPPTSGNHALLVSTTATGSWGVQLAVFAGGLTSNHLLISNCNVTHTNHTAAQLRCIALYSYSFSHPTFFTNYPTQTVVFQPLFNASCDALGEWRFTYAEALINATTTISDSILTGVEPPGAVVTRRRTHQLQKAPRIVISNQFTWDTLQTQINSLAAIGQVSAAIAVCKTQQYLSLKAIYDPLSSAYFVCNTLVPAPIVFESPISCAGAGFIDNTCLNGTSGGGGPIPDRVRTINTILPQPSFPPAVNSLDFSITGGPTVSVTGGMHGITITALTVTSVALTVPTNEFTLSGSPITSSGTFVIGKAPQVRNTLWAGPVSGAAAVPLFRSLVAGDLPTIDLSTANFTGVLPIANGGTGNGGPFAANRIILSSNPSGTQLVTAPALSAGYFLVADGMGTLVPGTLIPGAGVDITIVGDSFVVSAGGGAGVTLIPPSDLFADTSGGSNFTLSFAAVNQTANYVWAGPAFGPGSGVPTFRALVAADLPLINLATGVTGVLPLVHGGTNNAGPYTGSSLVMSNAGGTALVSGTATGTNGVVITTGPGASITVSGTGGMCTPATTMDPSCIPASLAFNSLIVGSLTVINTTISMQTVVQESISTTLLETMSFTLNGTMMCVGGGMIDDGCLPDRVRTINGISPTAAPALDFSIAGANGIVITPTANGIIINNTGGVDVDVTSVALALPLSVFAISGSPVTSAGTLTGSFISQLANTFFAGPVMGFSGVPSFRAIELGDLRALNMTNGQLLVGVTGGSPVATTITVGPNMMIVNTPGGILLDAIVPAESTILKQGTGIDVTVMGNMTFISNTGVTSVALALPASVFSISGSPVTTTGTLTGGFISQTANYIFAAPDNAAGVPSFRPMEPRDLPTLLNGQIFIGNTGMPPSASTLTAGSRITITPGMGTITVAVAFEANLANSVFAGPTSGGAAIPTFRNLVAADLTASPTFGATNGQLLIGSTGGAAAFATLTALDASLSIINGAGSISLRANGCAWWSVDVVRYFAVDYDAGSDANVGYSDVSMAAAGAVAWKTLEQLRESFPKCGQNRRAVIAINARAGGAVYRNKANTADDDFDALQDVYGYEYLLARGTATIASAGAVAFDDTTADQIGSGASLVPGTSAPGYTITGAITAISFGVLPATLAVEPALTGKRIRFSSTTTTVALRNVCRMIWMNDATSMTLDSNLPAVPVAADVFYIEEPGVVVRRIRISSASPSRTDDPSMSPAPFTATGIIVAGLRTTGGVANPQVVLNGGILLSFNFIDIPIGSTGATMVLINALDSYQSAGSYTNAAGTSIGLGVGMRGVGFVSMSNVYRVRIAASVMDNAGGAATGTWQIFSCGSTLLGSGSVVSNGVLVQDSYASIVSGGTTSGATTTGTLTIGRGTTTTQSRLRLKGCLSVGVSLSTASAQIYGVDITGCGAVPLMRFSQIGAGISIDDVVGSTGNTGTGLDLSRAVGATVYFGKRAPNTFSTSGSVILMGDTTTYVIADAARTDIKDDVGNQIIGTASVLSGPLISKSNDGVASIGQYKICRATTAFTLVRAALATTLAGSVGIVGVTQSPCTTAQFCGLVTAGTSWVQFDVAPTVADLAYLSTATAGNAQVTYPTAGNQVVVIGRVVGVSGTLGLVELEFDPAPALGLTNGQLLIGSTGAPPVAATLTGTTNQVNVANAAGAITLSTPQNIHTAATPTFASETLTAVSNQLTLGTTNTATISASAPAASRTYTIADPGANAHFVMDTAGNMVITDTPAVGEILTATSATTATWQEAAAGGKWNYVSTDEEMDLPTKCLFPVGSSHNRQIVCNAIDVMALQPVSCILRDLYVVAAVAPGIGTTRSYNLCTNTFANCLAGAAAVGCGTGTCLSCSMSGTATTCDSGVTTVTVAAGNAVQFRTLEPVGGPLKTRITAIWRCA